MRVGIVSTWGGSLPWALRLHDEGNEVRMWIDRSSHKRIGEGLIQKAGQYPDLLAWVKEGSPSMLFFDYSGQGKQADEARKAGVVTLGGSKIFDRLEDDRGYGQEVARHLGVLIPPSLMFKSFDDVAAWSVNCEQPVHLKPQKEDLGADGTYHAKDGEALERRALYYKRNHGSRCTCLVQAHIDGKALSTRRWWNGTAFVGPYIATYERKKFMNDDVGPSTGCSLTAEFCYEEEQPTIAALLHWDDYAEFFRKVGAGPGLIDVNAIVTPDGDAYFCEWTCRLGYDSDTTWHRLVPDLGKFLWGVATGSELGEWSDDIALSVRLSVQPYPTESLERSSKASADGKPLCEIPQLWARNFMASDIRMDLEEGLVAASPDGMVGLSIAVGPSVQALQEEVVKAAKDLDIAGLQYRTDPGKAVADDAKAIKKAGLEIHEGMKWLEESEALV